jgi:hypothetical protein
VMLRVFLVIVGGYILGLVIFIVWLMTDFS